MINRDYLSKYNMFQLLSGPNRIIYADCLIGLFGLISDRVDARCRKRDAVAFLDTVLITRTFDDGDTMTSVKRAKQCLAILKKYGYIESEFENLEEYILFTSEGQDIAQLIKKLDRPDETEYASKLSAVGSILLDPKTKESPYVKLLLPICATTRELCSELQRLVSNLKHRIRDDLAGKETLQDLYQAMIDAHSDRGPFDKFVRLDKETRQYGSSPVWISGRLEALRSDDKIYTKMVEECANDKKISTNEAKFHVEEMLAELRKVYGGSGKGADTSELLQRTAKIQREIQEFYHRGTEKAKLMNAIRQDTTSEKMSYILAHLEEAAPLLQDYSPCGFLLNRIFDPTDSRTSGIRQTGERTTSTRTAPRISNEDMEKLIAKERERQRRTMFEDTNALIKELLEEKGVLDEETFPLETKEDAMLIVIASMYGQAPKRCYDIKILNDVIDRKDQRYKKFLITKRGGKK